MKIILNRIALIFFFVVVFPWQLVAQGCWFSQLMSDASSSKNTDFKNFIRDNDDAFVAYEIIFNARGAKAVMKTDPDLLKKVSEVISDTYFMEKIGGQTGLESLLRNNKMAPCTTCGSSGATHLKNIDLYLEDVRSFVNTYGKNDNAMLVIRDLKTGALPTVDGSAFQVRVMVENSTTFNQVIKFEDSIDDLKNGCRYDVLFDNKTTIVFGEFKSYSDVNNLLGKGSDTYQQFTTYWGKISSIEELRYFFDKNKINDINLIKNRFKTIFENNADEFLKKMSPEMINNLDLDKDFPLSSFKDLISDTNSKLYSFITLN